MAQACTLRAARWVTHDDARTPHTPYLWCDECFKSLHYDAEGKALYTDYKVFPYVHDYQAVIMQTPWQRCSTA